MKAKAKLISTIVAMCLVITLGVFGILAVKTLNMSVGGNITFSADGLSLEVSQGVFKTDDDAEYTNITTQSGKLQAFAIDTNTKLSDIQDKIDSWTNLELTLDSKGDAILHFSVTNKMTTPLYVYIATSLGTNTNNNMNLTVSPNGTQISAGATTAFEITFDIIDTSINAGLAGFSVAVDFEKEERLPFYAQNKIDPETGLETTEVDYYYVEMGTYNGEPVRWRYVADSTGARYDGTSPVTSLSGYYVMETKITTSKAFLASSKYAQNSTDSKYYHNTEGYTNIYANDYALSDIRAYLTNTGSGGFMEALGITEDNSVYQMIKSRSITDLYSDIQYGGTAIDATNINYSLSLSGDKDIKGQSDKFWLMSHQEANTFFADKEARKWPSSSPTYYWLRSPYSSDTIGVSSVNASGSHNNLYVNNTYGVRPAFKI